jgi:hypothetical protein
VILASRSAHLVALLLLVLTGWASDDVVPPGYGTIGLGPSSISASTSQSARLGLQSKFGLGPRTPTAAQAFAKPAFTNLNDAAITTYTSTTGRWDPVNNAIKYANQRRQRTFTVAGTNYSADLIESARTNLLAAGTSEHFERWTVGTGTPVITTDTIACPNAEVVADTLTEGVGTGTQSVTQSITKAASSLAYVGSCYIKNKTGTREVTVELDDGTTTNGVSMRINPATGALTSAPAAFGAGWAVNTAAGTSGYTITDAGSGWYRVSIVATSDTTTTVRFRVALYNAADSYAGDGTSAVYLWGADVNQATFAGAVGLNRNVLLQSQTLNTTWTKTRSTITSDAVADPITGDTTADKIIEDNTVTNSHLIQQSFTKAASSLTFTCSVYLKAAERTWVRLACSGTNALTNAAGAYFDLTNGVTGSSFSNGAGWTLSSKTITSVGGGWYRCSIVVVSASETAIWANIHLATADGTVSYTGDATSGLYAWGTQLEYGGTLTQYWATTTAGLRTADELTSSLTGITDARTNLTLWSEQIDNAAWTKNADVTVTANSGTDPNGNGYCDLITEGVAGTAATISPAATISAGSTVAVSCWFRASALTAWVRVQCASDSGVNGWTAWYNLSTGAVGTQSVLGTGTASSITISSYGNGWYRCMSTGKVAPAATAMNFRFSSADADASTTRVSSSAYYAFGAQVERASTVGTYMPVGGTAITTTQTGLSRTTGTLVSIVMPRNWTGDQDGSTAFRILAGIDDANLAIRKSSGATTAPVYSRGDTATGRAITGASWTSNLVSGSLVQATITWSPGTLAGYINGGSPPAGPAQVALPWSTCTQIVIGSAATGTLADFAYNLILYSHQQVVPGSTLALMYANTSAP